MPSLSFPSKTSISWQNLYFFLAKVFSLDKTYISSWLNFLLLEKHIFILGLTSNSWQNVHLLLAKLFSWKNLYIFLAKLPTFDKTYIFS
jgi:hypothetical protein